MLHPSYKEMINKMNDTKTTEDKEITSRYSLVIAAAKRARQINSGSEPLVASTAKEKNLSIAVDELFSGKVHILKEDENASDVCDEIYEETPDTGFSFNASYDDDEEYSEEDGYEDAEEDEDAAEEDDTEENA